MIINVWVKNAKMAFAERELKGNLAHLILIVTLDFHAEETPDLLLRLLARYQPKLTSTVMRIMTVRWILFAIGSLQLKNCKAGKDVRRCTIMLITLQLDTQAEII